MDIDELTIRQVKQLNALLGKTTVNSDHWKIGKNYLIRTITMIDTGRLVAVTDQELVLEDAAWIADTGRFMQALQDCDFSEVEPFPSGQVIVNRSALIDAVQITHLPRGQK